MRDGAYGLTWHVSDPPRRSTTKPNFCFSFSLYDTCGYLFYYHHHHIFSILALELGLRFRVAMLGTGGGGRFYWNRNDESVEKVKGIVVLFVWVSIDESQLSNHVNLYSSLGWNSLVCVADFLNP